MCRLSSGLTVFAVVIMSAILAAQAAGGDLEKDLQAVLKQGRGTAEGRAAWARIASAGPEALPLVLKAMDTSDTVAANWLRTAFEAIVNRELKAGGGHIDKESLLAVVNDVKRQGRVRRLALELVDRLQPGTSAKLHPGWLQDPEFRYEAVALTLDKAALLAKQKRAEDARVLFRTAFEASRDVLQARAAAARLTELGETVSVAQHLGFLMEWRLVGPFDGKGQKGPQLTYPPEKGVDLNAEYDGQNGKVHWKHYQVREPSPTSGARHQALVNLCEKEALGNADDAVAFAYTEFVAPAQEAEFRGAADDNFTVYVNGVRAFHFEEWRNGVRHDRHRFKVKLREGKNTVLVKICQSAAPNPEPNWEFFLRVVDGTGKGIPFANALPAENK
jgi:hypothetical protein